MSTVSEDLVRSPAVQQFLFELDEAARDYPDTNEQLKAMGVSEEVLRIVRGLEGISFYDGAMWALEKLI